VYVSEDLERDPPEVMDIRVPMSAYMLGIQKAVIDVTPPKWVAAE
ncbi:hypothetical protein Tco_0081405, partial [Tanacetum coccineum]